MECKENANQADNQYDDTYGLQLLFVAHLNAQRVMEQIFGNHGAGDKQKGVRRGNADRNGADKKDQHKNDGQRRMNL